MVSGSAAACAGGAEGQGREGEQDSGSHLDQSHRFPISGPGAGNEGRGFHGYRVGWGGGTGNPL